MALYYRRGWRGGRYKNDVKSREFDKSVGYELDWPFHYLGKDFSTIDLNEKGGIISDGDEDGYQESMIPDPDPEDAPPEAVALLRLLDSLRAIEEDLVGVWYGVGFAATKLSAMISIMMSS
ncbi:hypothetical protein WN943_003381 [Citrus x changshan-huyou]